jgi:hypothetical protein
MQSITEIWVMSLELNTTNESHVFTNMFVYKLKLELDF